MHGGSEWHRQHVMGRDFSACPPDTATPGQIVSVVVTTLKQHPAHLHEDFKTLVIAALANVWRVPNRCPLSPAHQPRQFGYVRRDPPRLVAGH